jgi:hypothetical protein
MTEKRIKQTHMTGNCVYEVFECKSVHSQHTYAYIYYLFLKLNTRISALLTANLFYTCSSDLFHIAELQRRNLPDEKVIK